MCAWVVAEMLSARVSCRLWRQSRYIVRNPYILVQALVRATVQDAMWSIDTCRRAMSRCMLWGGGQHDGQHNTAKVHMNTDTHIQRRMFDL